MIQEINSFEFIDDAINVYKTFWDKCWSGHIEKQECLFDGSSSDLEMLGYCEYEIGFPEEEYESAAILLGNIVVKNTPLKWGVDKNKNIYIYSEEELYQFCINIKNYVYEFMYSDISQFEKFGFLLEKILIEMLMAEYTKDEVKGLLNIVKSEYKEVCESYSERITNVISEIYEPNSKKCQGLSNSLLGIEET